MLNTKIQDTLSRKIIKIFQRIVSVPDFPVIFLLTETPPLSRPFPEQCFHPLHSSDSRHFIDVEIFTNAFHNHIMI